MTNEEKIQRFMAAFGVSYMVANDYLFADNYIYSAACESYRLDVPA